ncbi:MAG: 7-cyano-7-deazaguanine synthase [Nitrospinae bacterium]|nr:7-cyano-7-deazaguanine synthase [Nitrospinota bacterium]
MTAALQENTQALPSIQVDVVEPGIAARPGMLRCVVSKHLWFDTAKMESYFFAQWEPVLYDVLLLAAAVEFCDITRHRPAHSWGRDIQLRMPVHDTEHWEQEEVVRALHDALGFLTGDRWHVTVYARQHPVPPPRQGLFSLRHDKSAVIPFSDGLDSLAVAGLAARELGESLVRVRLGGKKPHPLGLSLRREPFTSVPYKVCTGEQRRAESSARSRGFKFAMISGLAAYLSHAHRIIVPESGQGALGPSLVPVGQAYPDFRSHPAFAKRMERFLKALLEYHVRYEFPHIWHTKGETLARFINECAEGPMAWAETRSCWQQNRQIGVNGTARQCGICAACMLRRLTVHAAGQVEDKNTYVWEDLGADTFEAGVSPNFDKKKITRVMEEYAIAGTLHLDHLAGLLDSPANASHVSLEMFRLHRSLGLPQSTVTKKLDRLLTQHKLEWESFMVSLGPTSFVAKWACEARL